MNSIFLSGLLTSIREKPNLAVVKKDENQGYRRCPCGSDTIYYRINDNMVEIMAIVGMQDLKNIL